MHRLLAAALILFAVPAFGQNSFAEQRAEWNRPLAPFRVIGNVYYVGTAAIGAYLVTGPAGHVLIDGAMEESAAQIAGNIRRLGLRIEDVRYILINHAHWDHAGGLAELQRLSGARIVAGAADTPDLEAGFNHDRDDTAHFPPVRVARQVREGEALELGPVRLVAHLTPGHTRGCTSWTARVREGRRAYDVIFACSLSVAGQRLVDNPRAPDIVAEFESTFARLRAMRADIFLTFHDNQFDLMARRARLEGGDPLAFVDPAELGRRAADAEAAFRAELARQRSLPAER